MGKALHNSINLNELKDTIQDANLNFLLGSGMSTPHLPILGNIELLLSSLAKRKLNANENSLIEASLYKEYFDKVIYKNIEVLNNEKNCEEVLNNYKKFFQIINSILLHRKSTILCKQINLFTTNIDIYIEKALEELNLEYNDGFSGRFNPIFNLSSFKKTLFVRSLHYDNTSEIPVFNLLKVHGSLSWLKDEELDNIKLSQNLSLPREIQSIKIPVNKLATIQKDSSIDDLVNEVKGRFYSASIKSFIKAYKKLLIVNPTKEKFKDTLFNQTYYDLLRIYSNELEKENTILFVMGFSFNDEHIRELTLRAANSNPTLKIFIIAHTSKSNTDFQEKFPSVKNNNIRIFAPSQKEVKGILMDDFLFDFKNINEKIFNSILQMIESQEDLHFKNSISS